GEVGWPVCGRVGVLRSGVGGGEPLFGADLLPDGRGALRVTAGQADHGGRDGLLVGLVEDGLDLPVQQLVDLPDGGFRGVLALAGDPADDPGGAQAGEHDEDGQHDEHLDEGEAGASWGRGRSLLSHGWPPYCASPRMRSEKLLRSSRPGPVTVLPTFVGLHAEAVLVVPGPNLPSAPAEISWNDSGLMNAGGLAHAEAYGSTFS